MYTDPYNNNNMYSPYEPPMQEQKPRKKKRTGVKVLAWVMCAVLLGSVAGASAFGVYYAGRTIFPISEQTATNGAVSDNSNNNTGVIHINTPNNNVTKTEISATVMDVSEIVDAVISSVVAITGTYTETVNGYFGNSTYKSQVSGSGIIMGYNDTELLIVTNEHVVGDIEDIKVTFYDGSQADAIVKGTKSSKDLAVIAIKLADIPADAIYTIATFGESSAIKVGEAAIAVGNSLGYGISVTTGCISALNKTVTVDNVDYEDLIQTDAAINPGNSGGALFNAAGEVIGINSVKMSTTGVEGMGYAISISSVMDIIEELSVMDTKEKYSEDERGYLGITGVSITSEISERYGYPVGVAIRTITKDSGAYNAGLIKNDIIVAIADNTVETINEIIGVLQYYPAGATVEVVYYHMNSQGEYEKMTTNVTLSGKNG